jgi:hypothetical protein
VVGPTPGGAQTFIRFTMEIFVYRRSLLVSSFNLLLLISLLFVSMARASMALKVFIDILCFFFCYNNVIYMQLCYLNKYHSIEEYSNSQNFLDKTNKIT